MQKGQCPKAVHLTEGSRWHESKCKGPTEEKRYDMWSFQGLSISPSNWRCFSDPLNVWCWILSMGTRYNLMFSAPEGLSLSQKKTRCNCCKTFLGDTVLFPLVFKQINIFFVGWDLCWRPQGLNFWCIDLDINLLAVKFKHHVSVNWLAFPAAMHLGGFPASSKTLGAQADAPVGITWRVNVRHVLFSQQEPQ